MRQNTITFFLATTEFLSTTEFSSNHEFPKPSVTVFTKVKAEQFKCTDDRANVGGVGAKLDKSSVKTVDKNSVVAHFSGVDYCS